MTELDALFKKAAARIFSARSVAILTHARPDGDTLGSACALKRAIENRGGKAAVACGDAIPKRYHFMTGGDSLPLPEEYDLAVSVDVAARGLFSGGLEKLPVDILFDHHPSNERFAELCIVEPSLASAGELLYSFFEAGGVEIDQYMATCLYAAVSTDTGCFRHPNTTARTHRVAAELMERGVDVETLHRTLFVMQTIGQVRAFTKAAETLEFFENGKIAVLRVSLDLQQETGISQDDMDAITQLPRNIEGVEAGAVFKQISPTTYKVSMRSSALVNSSEVCARFGGGGHVRAAGCTMEGEYPALRQKLVAAMREALGAAK